MVQETLYVHRSVQLYKIPPRPAAGGHRSGEWLVADKIFDGRLRVVARGDLTELRLEEGSAGDLFALCPIEYGTRAVAVEPVVDSSRYFVIRVTDPSTGRHAFLGMGFAERGDAFDFQAAISDHERRIKREREAAAAAPSSSEPGAPPSSHSNLSLAEGQTIRVDLKAKVGGRPLSGGGAGGSGGGGGLLAKAAAALGPLSPHPAASGAQAALLVPPPPPPQSIGAAAAAGQHRPGGPGGGGNPFADAKGGGQSGQQQQGEGWAAF